MWTPRWCWEQLVDIPRLATDVLRSQRAPRNHRVGYIGWVGHENLGDQAIFHAIRRELSPAHLRHFAGVRKERVLARLLTTGRLYKSGVLGGGTLILGGYLRSVETLMNAGLSVHCLGAGVEEIDIHKPQDREFVDRWKAVLQQMGVLYVRGPRSKNTLESLGVNDAEVVGDAALLLAGPPAPDQPSESVLGVCISLPTIFSREVNDALFRSIAYACRQAQGHGWKVKVFNVSRGDSHVSNELRQTLGLSPHDIQNHFEDGPAFVRAVQKCTIFLGVRLHSVILAHCASVPAVMVAYAPKCVDHMEAVDMSHCALSRAQWQASTIYSKIQEVYCNREAISSCLKDRCMTYKNRLSEIAGVLRSKILNSE
jgi:polysaccharide pyruvyl transferase WcaK-like protein